MYSSRQAGRAGFWRDVAFGSWCGSVRRRAPPPQPMLTGGLTSQPIGHYEFCKSQSGRMLASALRDAGPLP